MRYSFFQAGEEPFARFTSAAGEEDNPVTKKANGACDGETYFTHVRILNSSEG